MPLRVLKVCKSEENIKGWKKDPGGGMLCLLVEILYWASARANPGQCARGAPLQKMEKKVRRVRAGLNSKEYSQERG